MTYEMAIDSGVVLLLYLHYSSTQQRKTPKFIDKLRTKRSTQRTNLLNVYKVTKSQNQEAIILVHIVFLSCVLLSIMEGNEITAPQALYLK